MKGSEGMITSFRRLVLALLIGTGFLFSGTFVIPQVSAAQETAAPKKQTKKQTKKKTTKKPKKKSKKSTKKSTKPKKEVKKEASQG
jgi:hypothetical protein